MSLRKVAEQIAEEAFLVTANRRRKRQEQGGGQEQPVDQQDSEQTASEENRKTFEENCIDFVHANTVPMSSVKNASKKLLASTNLLMYVCVCMCACACVYCTSVCVCVQSNLLTLKLSILGLLL